MNVFTATSFGILFLGSILYITGLLIYWNTNPVSEWGEASIVIGLLLLLGAIIMLCISMQY